MRHYPKVLAVLIAVVVAVGVGYKVSRKSPQDHLNRARVLQQKGDARGAMIELKTALQMEPENGAVRLMLGQAEYASSDFAAAEKELSKAIELDPRMDEARLFLARTLIARHKPDLLLAQTSLSDQASLTDLVVWLALRAKANYMLGGNSAAQASLAEADKLIPAHPETLYARAQILQAQGDTTGALAQLEKALAKSPNDADYWVSKAELQHALNHEELAFAAYSRALELAPLNIPALVAVTQRRIDTGELDQAEASLKVLRSHAPRHIIGLYLDAELAFSRKNYQAAYFKLQPVLQAAPDSVPTQLLAGAACSALGKQEEALLHLNRVLQTNPGNVTANKLLAAALLQTGQVEKAKAIVDALQGGVNDTAISILRGEILLNQGDYTAARTQFEQASTSGPNEPGTYLDLAASEEGLGDQEAMFKALGKASELDQTSSRADMLLINAYIKHQKYADALKAVDKLAGKLPKLALPHNARGVIYTAMKDSKRARSSFEQALEVDPKYLEAATNLAFLDIQANDLKSARSRFEELLKHAPSDSGAWLELAKIDRMQKDEGSVRVDLENAILAENKNVKARLLLVRYWLGKDDFGRALHSARDALTVTGDDRFYELIALTLKQQGDKQGVLNTYEQWAHVAPNTPYVWTRLGQAQALMGKRNEALASIDLALKLRSDFLYALSAKLSILAEDGSRSADAIKLARMLQVRYPKQAVGYLGEASALVAMKKYQEAAQMYARAAQVMDQGNMIVEAAQSYEAAGNLPESIKLLQHWLESHPKDAPARNALALVLGNSLRGEEAVRQYRQLLQANPRDPVAYNNMAMLLSDMKAPGAVAAAEQAYKLSPNTPAIQDTLGWTLTNSVQAKRGLPLIKQAFEQSPDSLEMQWHYIKALVAVGDRTLARQQLDSLLTQGRKFAQVEEARQLLASLKH